MTQASIENNKVHSLNEKMKQRLVTIKTLEQELKEMRQMLDLRNTEIRRLNKTIECQIIDIADFKAQLAHMEKNYQIKLEKLEYDYKVREFQSKKEKEQIKAQKVEVVPYFYDSGARKN